MKTLITPDRRHPLSPDEAVCMSWLAFRTSGAELPRGSNTGVFGALIAGGALEAEALKIVAAACALWAARANEPISRHAPWSFTYTQNREAIVEMLNRQRVTYEDRRTQSSLAGAYRGGRKIAEYDGREFVSKKGEPVNLSKLGELPAMASFLSTLQQCIDECTAAGQPLRVEVS